MTFDELERTAYINDDKPTLNIIEVCREHLITNAYNDGYETGLNEASETNYDEGLADGKSEGYDDGYETGRNEASETNYDEGLADGKSEGYDDGYEAGYAAAMRDNNTPY